MSVLLPVFDAESTLPAALESMLTQSFGDLEIVAVDDGSRDGSARVLAEAARRDPRLHPLYRPREGLVPALQTGLAAWCRGQYVARMDADDVAAPDRLERQLEFLAANPAVVAVGGAVRYLVAGKITRRTAHPPRGGPELDALLEREPPLVHPTATIRRDALLRVGGYRSAFRRADDYDLWLRLSEHGGLANLPEVVLDYRVGAAQVSLVELEASVVAKIGARICAQARRSGLPDPAPEHGPIDRRWLHAHGQDRRGVRAMPGRHIRRPDLVAGRSRAGNRRGGAGRCPVPSRDRPGRGPQTQVCDRVGGRTGGLGFGAGVERA